MTGHTSGQEPAENPKDVLGGPDRAEHEDELGGPDRGHDDELGGPDLAEHEDELGRPGA